MACQYSVWQVTKTIQGNSVSISNNLPIFTKNYFEVKIHIGASVSYTHLDVYKRQAEHDDHHLARITELSGWIANTQFGR